MKRMSKNEIILNLLTSEITYDDKEGLLIQYVRNNRMLKCFHENGKFGEDTDKYQECESCENSYHCIIVNPKISEDRKNKLRKRKQDSYQEYLESEHWKFLRLKILEIDGHSCRICNSTNGLNVHHRTYEHLGFEWDYLNDLITLCKECHQLFHGGGRLK